VTNHAHLVDLAQRLPDEMLVQIGELTVLFGRLEHIVLLAIKRKRGITLQEAQRLYKGYSLGAKLFGKKPCKNVGENCQNYNSEVCLSDYSNDVQGLKELCTHIQDLTSKRNSIMHGLITTVAEETVLSHNRKVYQLKENELWDLKEDVIFTIAKLNKLIPVPGLHAGWATGPSLDLYYEASATSFIDPIVTFYNSNSEKKSK